MTLDDVLNMWAIDCEMDRTELGEESLKLPKMHSKYLRHFSEERLILRKMEEDRKELSKLKHDYYRGILPEEDLKEQGWDPFRLSILKSDVHMYLDSDKDMIRSNLKMSVQQEKVDALESIIRAINNRGYLIKAAIDYERFKVGG
jgi:hypothetical protein